MSKDEEIAALSAQVALLKEQVGQLVAMSEANNALILALIAQSKDKPGLLAIFQSMRQQLEASPVHARRTDQDKEFVRMLHQHIAAQLGG